jgi:peptidoglycan/xylan/chitin deacetylase (PgdA/CDA1 family)
MPVRGVREAEPGADVLIWMEQGGVRVPLVTGDPGARVCLHFDVRATFEHILFEQYCPPVRKPMLASAPFDYHKIPGPVRGAAARVLTTATGRFQKNSETSFPSYPIEKSVEAVLQAMSLCCGKTIAKPGLRVMLTHDVDEAGSVPGIAALSHAELERGVASAWFVAGKVFRSHEKQIEALKNTGHEIGLHGTQHDLRFAFLSEQRMRDRLDSVADYLERFGVAGFRSPFYLRTDLMFQVLAERFSYDSSVPDTDHCSTGATARGCGVLHPFMRGSLVEIPVAIPFEIPWMGGLPPKKLVAYWSEKMDFAQASGGLFVVNTHSDAHMSSRPSLRGAYCELLDELKTREAQFLLPRDVAGALGHA